MTIHITPEPEFSYVSFESNIPMTSYLPIIDKVLKIFQPGKFILTIFANRVRTPRKLQKSTRTKFFSEYGIFVQEASNLGNAVE